jgi:hypothetical protein
MATLEDENRQREALRTRLDALAEIEPQSLVRADILGKDLSFEPGLPYFRRTLDLFRRLSDINLDGIPFEVLNSLTSVTQEASELLQRIQTFTVQSNPQNPGAARDQLINQVRDRWGVYYQAITPVLAYAGRQGVDLDSLERETRGTLALVKDIATETRAESQKILTEMQGALDRVRQAAAEAGVAQHAIHFKQEAEAHRKHTYWWLGFAAVFGAATIAYGLYSFGSELHSSITKSSTGSLLILAFSRFIVISVLSYGVIFCARNYAASQHNFVVNRHRQNALSTFETFVKAASDPSTKDAVLIEATQSIFSPQTTGYLSDEAVPQQAGQIIEIVRRLMETKT